MGLFRTSEILQEMMIFPLEGICKSCDTLITEGYGIGGSWYALGAETSFLAPTTLSSTCLSTFGSKPKPNQPSGNGQ